jgi:hypothetical protein
MLGCNNHIPLSKRITVLCGSVFIVPMQYEGLRASILYQVPIFIGLPGIQD